MCAVCVCGISSSLDHFLYPNDNNLFTWSGLFSKSNTRRHIIHTNALLPPPSAAVYLRHSAVAPQHHHRRRIVFCRRRLPVCPFCLSHGISIRQKNPFLPRIWTNSISSVWLTFLYSLFLFLHSSVLPIRFASSFCCVCPSPLSNPIYIFIVYTCR